MTEREKLVYNTHLKRSWEAYNRNIQKWESKGYALGTTYKSISEYEVDYKRAIKRGEKNIAREFAKADRVISYSEARQLRGYFEQKQGRELKVKEVFGNVDNYIFTHTGKTMNGEDFLNIYTGRQAIYMEIKLMDGEDKANEYFGY